MIRQVSVVFVLLALLDPCTAQGRPKTGRVSGTVVDALGDPIMGTEVWLSRWSGRETKITKTMTDGEGVFVMNRVPFDESLQVWSTAPGRMLSDARVKVTPAAPNALRPNPA